MLKSMFISFLINLLKVMFFTIETSRYNRFIKVTIDFYFQLNIPAIKLCPGEGRYPYNKNCSNIYYDCKRDSYGILQGYLLNCPNGLIYSNILRRCKHAKYFPMCRARHPL